MKFGKEPPMSFCKPVGFVLALAFVCFAFGLTIGLVWNAAKCPRRLNAGCDPCPACNPKVVHDCASTGVVPHYWYLGDNRAMVNLKHIERPIFVNTQDTQMVPHLLTGAGWMKGETKYFREAVREGMTVVEVGANFGYYSLMWASQMRGHNASRLILIEADPNTYGLLKHSLDINGFGPPSFVQNLNLAVGLQSGHTFWKYPYGRVLNSRVAEKAEVDSIPSDLIELLKSGKETRIQSGSSYYSYLPISPLSEILPKVVDFMKIDIEGYEYEAFQSLRKFFKNGGKVKHLAMEVSPVRHKGRQSLAGSAAAISQASFQDFMRDVEQHFRLAYLTDEGQCVPVQRDAIVDELVLCLRPVEPHGREEEADEGEAAG